ncbi:MAG: hypothetical protein ABIO99_01880 [Candidatus Limnocylindria bacterium]
MSLVPFMGHTATGVGDGEGEGVGDGLGEGVGDGDAEGVADVVGADGGDSLKAKIPTPMMTTRRMIPTATPTRARGC